jgi:hypothetical protein
MKPLASILVLLLSGLLYQLGHADEAPDPAHENYDYLARMHVPKPVIACAAAFDHWVSITPKYDTLIVPDRRVLSAKIDDDATFFSAGNPVPVDTVIVMRAFAKMRGKPQWTRVNSRCGVRDGEVVGVSLTPNVKPMIVQ